MKPIFFLSVESLTLTKMDRLTITQRIKIIKTYCKNGDSRWTAIFCTKFSSVMKHISHTMGMLINEIAITSRKTHCLMRSLVRRCDWTNSECYGHMITNFFACYWKIRRGKYVVSTRRCHTTRANVAISHPGDINWPPRSFDLTKLDFLVRQG